MLVPRQCVDSVVLLNIGHASLRVCLSRPRAWHSLGSLVKIHTDKQMPFGKWVHVAASIGHSDARIYVGGTSVKSEAHVALRAGSREEFTVSCSVCV